MSSMLILPPEVLINLFSYPFTESRISHLSSHSPIGCSSKFQFHFLSTVDVTCRDFSEEQTTDTD